MRDTNRMRDHIELQLDNKQIVSFVIGSLVVLGVVFASGVLVGKQLATTNVPQDEVAEEEAAPRDPLAAIDAKELTYAEELTKPKAVDPVIEPTRDAKAAPKPPKAEPEPKAEPAKKEAPKVAEPEKAAEPAVEEPEKRREGLAAAFDKASSGKGGAFALQVASLPSRDAAEKTLKRLEKKGLEPYVVEADVPGKGRYYRVKIGSYASKSEADEAAEEVAEKVGSRPIVTSAQ